jgi:hypothetical protein
MLASVGSGLALLLLTTAWQPAEARHGHHGGGHHARGGHHFGGHHAFRGRGHRFHGFRHGSRHFGHYRHHRHFRFGRHYSHHHRYGFYGLPFVYGGFYGYGNSCYWLKRRAIRTGSHYWWRRYRACRYGWY